MREFDIKSLGDVIFHRGGDTIGQVAVVIPLYNYEQFIIECLDSVVNQTLDQLSIVVVDDASSDSGADRAIHFLRKHAARFCSARVIRHKKNQGLSMTRNSGIAWSAEPLLFMLDADNVIRPPALARLKSALDVDGADFSYSQLFIFGNEIQIGPADIWHIDRIRFGNTIDAMALLRRSALERARGYSVLADDHGWEDYDLWCRFFMLGMRGVFVPELLCEYRRHGQSMLQSRTNTYADALSAEMSLRYPEIFNHGAQIPPLESDFSVRLPLERTERRAEFSPSIAVIMHLPVENLIDEMLSYVNNIPYPFHVFVSTDTAEKKVYIEQRARQSRAPVEVRVTPQRGCHIAPRLLGFKDVYERCDYVLLLHSKESPQDRGSRSWRTHLLEHLVGSEEVVTSILALFEEVAELGVIAAQHFEPIRESLGWGDNFEVCKALAARFGADLKVNGYLDYPSGSMFWARAVALRPFFDAQLGLQDFVPQEVDSQRVDAMASAVERLFFVTAERAGYSWVKVALPNLFDRQDAIKPLSHPNELRQFLETQRRILRDRRHGRQRNSELAGAPDD